MQGRKILFIICGGIAAYKALDCLRLLIRNGFDIKTIMTKSAHEFITPLSVASLTGQMPYTDIFNPNDEARMGHIQLARWADMIIIAPATSNIIAKIAHGICDDLASTCMMAQNAPHIIIAPAMNPMMWSKKVTCDNIEVLRKKNYHIVGPDNGEMACGEVGTGKLLAPQILADYALDLLYSDPQKSLNHKKILITGGPTYEAIDPVRYIANHSSGKQAIALVRVLAAHGAEIVFIHGPIHETIPQHVKTIDIQTAQEMYHHTTKIIDTIDVAICAAAVCDWHVIPKKQKIKKQDNIIPKLTFQENPDILSYIGHLPISKRPELVIGFAAESNHTINNAIIKKEKKSCDWIIANDINNNVFGHDENSITIIDDIQQSTYTDISKYKVAQILCDKIYNYYHK